jgi:hypothetical protein
MSLDFLKAVQEKLILGGVFTLRLATGIARDVQFLEDGTLGIGSDEYLLRWALAYTSQGATLTLSGVKDKVCVLTLRSNGDWKGREFKSNGYVVLSPHPSAMDTWVTLASPSSYYRKLTPVQVSEKLKITTNPKFAFQESLYPQIDWKQYEYNLSDTKFEDIPKNITAVILVGFNRLDYFKQVVRSLVVNESLKKFPVFVFLDKPVRAEEASLQDDHEKFVKNAIPWAVVIKRPVNFGCGRNIIDARNQILLNLNYQQAFVFEDDMVVSRTYLDFCLNLMEWSKRFSNVGAVQGWDKAIMSYNTKVRKQMEVHVTYTNWWGYLITKEAWEKMYSLVNEYVELFLGAHYHQRPHISITKWFTLIMEKATSVEKNAFLLDEGAVADKLRYFKAPPTGQDAITMHALEVCGLVRLAPTVNRGLYIGKLGIHMNPKQFIRDGFESMSLEEFLSDSNRLDFYPRVSNDPVVTDPSSNISYI